MNPFLAQIIMFGGNFAPRGWALCHGQLLPINQNQALFSLLGTTYGGDGRTTFGLPDLRGRAAVGEGTGPGLTPRRLGQKIGTETNIVTVNQMPSHSHALNAAEDADTDGTDGTLIANHPDNSFSDSGTVSHSMSARSIGNTGGGQPINNIQPIQVINYIIALQGTFPSRS